MSREQGIDWDDVIKKEARGINDEDLGEVQEVGDTYVLVQKGLINKEKYYIPQNEVESYDGNILRFKLSKEEIKIPLKKEEVEVKKEPYVKEEVVLKKRRVTETKTITEEVKSERLADTSGKDVE